MGLLQSLQDYYTLAKDNIISFMQDYLLADVERDVEKVRLAEQRQDARMFLNMRKRFDRAAERLEYQREVRA